MKILYQGHMGLTRSVVRHAQAAVIRARSRGDAAPLPALIALVREVVAQTRARVPRADTRYPGTVVSVFPGVREVA